MAPRSSPVCSGIFARVELRIALAQRLYAALANADLDSMATLLAADFSLTIRAPLGVGDAAIVGRFEGLDAAWRGVWSRLGRVAAVAIEVDRAGWVGCEDGRLLVNGRYLGSARDDPSRRLDAPFSHLLEFVADPPRQIRSLIQITDSAAWNRLLVPAPALSGGPGVPRCDG